MQRKVETLEEALDAYFGEYGDTASQPANSSWYDDERGGWVLENINGPLALVHEDGTITEPVHDAGSGDWVLPDVSA
jgi:hypothetical protein